MFNTVMNIEICIRGNHDPITDTWASTGFQVAHDCQLEEIRREVVSND